MGRSQFKSNKHLRLCAFLCLVFFIAENTFANPSQTLSIAGWPTPPFENEKPSSWLAKDPVLGRLICPSLTRLNLQKKESETLILKSIQVETLPTGGSKWILHLRTGIYWWSGKELDSRDLSDFLEKNLVDLISNKSSGQWNVPEFTIQTERDFVKIQWKESPQFGPYLLNDAVLWKERNTQDSIKFECVGRFVPFKESDSLLLTPNARYLKDSQTYRFEDLTQFREKKRKGYEFLMPDDQTLVSGKRKALEKAGCESLLDLPLVSAIVWFDNKHMTQETRKHLSSLIPREAFQLIAAGHWGSLPSSLLPKNHPGYENSVKNIPFSLQRAKERRSLFFGTVRGNIGLVEKVVSDNFLVGGFDVQFVDSKDSRIDGLLTGLFLPWPDMDLYDSFHSHGKNLLGARKSFQPEFDKVLARYRLSLTQQSPDFNALKAIHKHLHEMEYLSVLMQHQTCLETKGITKKKTHSIDIKDPDWFLDLLTKNGGVS